MSDDEKNHTGKRLKRYAKVSGAVGGLAARIAGERFLGLKIDRDKHALQLTKALGNIKGPLMKVAQILATIPQALPEEYMRELRALQSNAPAMGWIFVKRRMINELGRDWQQLFKNFEQEAAAAASLGQVHKAELLGGEVVACKLQYPDMTSVVEADLKQLKLILSLYERMEKAISTDQIFEEVGDRMREELDYALEGQRILLYQHMLKAEPGVHVPNFYPEYSTGRLLTMGWLQGVPLLDMIGKSQEDRNQLAMNMFRAWYVPFYEYGIIHGDPHLGNYTIREDYTVNLLDYGCVRVFPPSFVGAVINLYKALLNDDEALAVHAYETWGFKDLSKELIEALNQWARFIYGPLLENRARRIQEVESQGVHGREVAINVYDALKRAGGIEPPKTFVFMDRAALGLGSVFMHLKAEINWYEIFHDLIEGFSEDTLASKQKQALESVGLKVDHQGEEEKQ